jgi:hypothetical protein
MAEVSPERCEEPGAMPPQPLVSGRAPWTLASFAATAASFVFTSIELVAAAFDIPLAIVVGLALAAATCGALGVGLSFVALIREPKGGAFAASISALVALVPWLFVGLLVLTVEGM